jgi:hypothetical protein
MVSKPMARIMAIDRDGKVQINLVIRPQLKHKARKPLSLTNCHEQEVKGTFHEGKSPKLNLGTYFIIF